MRMSLNLSGLLSRSGNTGVARPAASAEPDSTTEIERSAAGFIRVLGGKNEALRNRCEHVIGLTRVIEPLTNELSAVFLDFQKVVQELQATTGTAEAAVKLLQQMGADIVAACFVINLPELGGAKKIEALGVPVRTLVAFEGH